MRANRPPAAPTPTIRRLFHLADWGETSSPAGATRRQQRELAHSGRSEGRRLSGAAGGRRHSRTALASERVGSQRDSGRPQPMVFVGPNGTQDVFEAGKGDVIFAPQGHYHYFENAIAAEFVALIVFNSDAAEPKDDIGIGQSLTAIPNDVLSAVLNVPV